jgi:hypothetical protein
VTALKPEVLRRNPSYRASIRQSHISPKEGEIWGTRCSW